MTAEPTTEALCEVIAASLREATSSDTLSGPVTMASKMGDPREWDSLSFVAVFLAVGAAYDIDLDDDDAIHFQTAAGIHEFLQDMSEA